MDARLVPGKNKLKETDTLPKALKKKKKRGNSQIMKMDIIIIIIIDRFYIALFSALEQTHCARMWFYMSV